MRRNPIKIIKMLLLAYAMLLVAAILPCHGEAMLQEKTPPPPSSSRNSRLRGLLWFPRVESTYRTSNAPLTNKERTLHRVDALSVDQVTDMMTHRPPPASTLIKTRVRDLADAFALAQQDQQQNYDIDTAQLISACWKFEHAMKSVGQGQSAKDLRNNILKVEQLYNKAPSPDRNTFHALLEYEKSTGIHDQQPGKLHDPSGAIGLLWIGRSLSFQSRMYSLVIESPNRKPIEAALQAYEEVLEPYHGKLLQRVYRVALSTMTPPRHEMLRKIGGFAVQSGKQQQQEYGPLQEQSTIADLQQLVSVWKPLLKKWKETFQELELEDNSRV